MKNCEECHDECAIKDRFDTVFMAAAKDLKSFYVRKTELTTEQFWPEFEAFYGSYPECVMIALDEVLMSAHASGESIDMRVHSK